MVYIDINLAAPTAIIISAHVVICIRPLSVVFMEMVTSATMVFGVVKCIQPLLVVFMDAAATAVVELMDFVTVVRPTTLYSNNMSVGSQFRL